MENLISQKFTKSLNVHLAFLFVLSLSYIIPFLIFGKITLFYHDTLDSEIVYVRNSLGAASEFRPGILKNGGRKRKVEISNDLSTLLDQWMIHQRLPKTHLKYKRIFPFTKSHAADILKRSVKEIGIKWQGAFSGFRKFNPSTPFSKPSGILSSGI